MNQFNKYKALLFLFAIVMSFSSCAQKKLSIRQKIQIKKKLNEGKLMVYGQDYRGALSVFKTVLSIDHSNPTANFRAAQCHVALNKPHLGIKYGEKALLLDSTIDKEVYFVMAESYHLLGKLDKAKKFYKTFKSKSSKSTNKNFEVDKRIAQCDYAKKAMETPVDVKIENMGNNINTFNPEYSASTSADGKILVFTSRRADSKGGLIDEMSDKLYFEDIYMSQWNDTTNEWNEAESVRGGLNSESHDAVLSIAPDGKSIYVYRNEEGETKSGDIYISRMNNKGQFGTPKPVDEGRDVNSSYFESSASVTMDGSIIFFVSDRHDGKGQADIYWSRKEGKGWSKPINLGDSINTAGDESGVFIHPSGQVLFFTSTGHDNLGSYDIFMSKKIDGVWSKAVNLGYPINTVGNERTFSITADGKTGFISASYKDSKGGSDIYRVDLSNLDLLKK